MSFPASRRFFLGAATAASATRVWGANDKINMAVVGIGGRGSGHVGAYSRMPEARVTALCDVNQAARERAQASLAKASAGKAKEYEDMREAFADPNVDAVSIATPNHWHALASIWAMKAGKDVYCEKPASYNIHEGLKMVEVARETRRMLQIGSQHRSMPFKLEAMRALHQGLIGKIYLAKGLCFKRRVSIGRKPDTPVPAGLNWDLFLGPAPMRPFNELRFRYNWHWFWDTGNGDIGNQGVHEIGVCRWGLQDPGWPKSAYSQGGKYAYDDDQETPNTQLASFDYGGREIVFEVRGLLTGGEGSLSPARRPRPQQAEGTPAGAAPPPLPPQISVKIGNLFYGTEGWAAMGENGFHAFKGESSELIMEQRPERGDSTVEHMRNFLEAVKSRDAGHLHDGIENAHYSAGLCHLANISYRTGRKLELAPGPQFVNDPAANKLLTRDEYRQPYVV